VSKLGFEYSSVITLTRQERSYYIDKYFEEKEEEARILRES